MRQSTAQGIRLAESSIGPPSKASSRLPDGTTYLVSDECHEDTICEGEHISPGALDDTGRVISVFTVSKSYAMTGWRIGYVAASPEIAPLISKLQEAVTACASSVSQKAAEAAIGGAAGERARAMANGSTSSILFARRTRRAAVIVVV